MSNWTIPEDKQRFRWVTWLTTSRIPMSIAFAVWVTMGDPLAWPQMLGLLVLLTCIEISDGLDGHLARTWNVRSEWGAMLDPYSDSVSRLIVYFGLGQAALVHPALILVMALRDVSVSYCRILLTKSGRSVAAMLSGKIKAVVQAVGAYAALLSVYLPLLTTQENAPAIARWTITLVVGAVTAWSVGQYAQSALGSMGEDAGESQ